MFAVIEDEPAADAPWLRELNPEQRSAVRHPGGPLLILAGAGTGKTTTLCARVAWLVAEGIAPERILLLTFTRRAAREMLAAGPGAGLDARGSGRRCSAARSTRWRTGSCVCTPRRSGSRRGSACSTRAMRPT